MKKITKIKAMFIALMMLLGLIAPVTATAQHSDGFFRGGNDNYENRSEGINDNTGSGIQNDDFGAPLGSGLLILTALGAGYAVAKRRRKTYRRGAALIFALILLLGMTNCKKKKTEPITPAGSNQVSITLNVDNGSRADVNPPHVKFVEGDRILVAYDGKYVGYIDHNGTCFTGTINATGDNTKPLYFYFLGNKADVSSLTEGSSTTCTVNISDQTYQTENPMLPVISFSASDQNFNGAGSYTARLHNKCSLMKFNVTTPSTAPICITGMNNKVTVYFNKISETGTGLGESDTDNGFKYDKEGEGILKMTGGSSTERWVIVLPQAALEGTGEAFSDDNAYFGTRPVLSAITTDQYLNSGVSMTVNTPAWDGDLSKLTASSSERYATANNGVTISGTLTADVKVSIADGATVTLNGANINNGSKSRSVSCAGITCKGSATLNLYGGSINNINSSSDGYPGIQAGPSGNTLTIEGTGSLSAQGGSNAAGIGGGNGITCGNISLMGGTISACGGDNAPGIGSGQSGSCGNIHISRAVEKINVTGGSGASVSIGTNGGGTLSVDDVDDVSYLNTDSFVYHPVNLSTLTSNYIAKCGDVLRGTLANNVTISIDDEAPATVTLSSANINYEGIVCVSPNVKAILFGTNSVIANSNPGIQAPASGTLTIDGSGSINVQSYGYDCAGIGGNDGGNCGNIRIKGGNINSCGGRYGAGIGSGSDGTCGNIEIEGGTISATGGVGAAGIGSGWGGSCGSIKIEGGGITASGGDGAAGIGSGQNGSCGNIQIQGGEVSATGSGGGSDIGAGSGGECGTITIPLPEGALSGLFSVSDDKQVRFSRGNLLSNGTFATNQYTYGAHFAPNSYNGPTNDWYTLSADEWEYLFSRSSYTSVFVTIYKFGFATVNGVHGLIILPDVYSGPAITPYEQNHIYSTDSWDDNTYSDEAWTTMENNGVVFLPAAGYYYDSGLQHQSEQGCYLSSSVNQSLLFIGQIGSAYTRQVNVGDQGSEYQQMSVRLVRTN